MTVIFIVLAVVLGWGVFIYNRLVGDKNRVLSAWSDIDVQLKRRHDLIPKLVDAVKHYAAYESATLTEVTELRTRSEQSASVAEIGGVESELVGRVRHLVALAEDYPDLKADDAFLILQKDLADLRWRDHGHRLSRQGGRCGTCRDLARDDIRELVVL